METRGEKIDICINNAGVAKLTPVFAEDINGDFKYIIQTNLFSTWYITKLVAGHMKKYGTRGSIINIASINSDKFPAKQGAAYSCKAGVIHLTKTLVEERSPYYIRINCISPSIFRTPMDDLDIDPIISLIPCGYI